MTKKEIDSLYHEAAEYSGVHKFATFQRLYNAKNGKRKLSYPVYCAWYDLVRGLPTPMFSASDIGPEQCMIRDAESRELMVYIKAEGRLVTSSEARQLPTVFPSRAKARSAKWHHVMQSGEPMSHTRWDVIPAIDERR
jgi:hypothetical protein